MRTLDNAPPAVAEASSAANAALAAAAQREIGQEENSALVGELRAAIVALGELTASGGGEELRAHARLSHAELSRELAHRLPPGREAGNLITEVASHLQDTLSMLDAQAPAYGLALSLLALVMEDIAGGRQGNDKEQALGEAIDAAHAAALYRTGLDDPVSVGDRVLLTRLLAECHGSDRDVSLNRAVRYGWEAVRQMLADPALYPIDLPATYLQLGNALSKLGWDRRGSLRQAQQAYELGIEACDPQLTPNLKNVLGNNLNWLRSLIAAENYELPEPETAARFERAIQHRLDHQQIDDAISLCQRAIGWSWTLTPAPYIRTASFHSIMAQLFEIRGLVDHSMAHRRAELAIVYANQDAEHFRGGVEHCLNQLDAAVERTGYGHRDALLAGVSTALADSAGPYGRGWELLEGRDPDAAGWFEQVLGLYPFHPYAIYGLAGARMLANHVDEALPLFTETLSYLPDMVEARLNRAQLYVLQGSSKAALADLNTILETAADNTAALRLKAALLLGEQDYAGAKAPLDRLVALEPSYAAYLDRATCLRGLDDQQGETADLEAALGLAATEEERQTIEQLQSKLKGSE